MYNKSPSHCVSLVQSRYHNLIKKELILTMIKLKTYSLGVKHHKPQSLYNIQSLPSYEVNIKICQPPRGCFPLGWKQPLEGWQLDIHLVWIMKAITVLLYRNYTKMFKTCLFWQNKKQLRNWTKYNFNTLPVVKGCRPGDNLLSPSILYIFGLSTRLSSSLVNIPWKHPNCLITFIL
jgi:hypothetical protein